MKVATVSNQLFISTPISTFSQVELLQFENWCRGLETKLKDEFDGLGIYCAILGLMNSSDFDNPETSVRKDLEALSSCSGFVMLYPKKVASSVLIELGYAIALKKPILIITHARNELPHLTKGLEISAERVKILEVKSIQNESLSHIVEFISKNDIA